MCVRRPKPCRLGEAGDAARRLPLEALGAGLSDCGAPRDVRESERHLFSVLTVPVMGRPPARFAALVVEAEHDFMRAHLARLKRRRRAPLALWCP